MSIRAITVVCAPGPKAGWPAGAHRRRRGRCTSRCQHAAPTGEEHRDRQECDDKRVMQWLRDPGARPAPYKNPADDRDAERRADLQRRAGDTGDHPRGCDAPVTMRISVGSARTLSEPDHETRRRAARTRAASRSASCRSGRRVRRPRSRGPCRAVHISAVARVHNGVDSGPSRNPPNGGNTRPALNASTSTHSATPRTAGRTRRSRAATARSATRGEPGARSAAGSSSGAPPRRPSRLS